nr:endonuclease/exonuclease/phosphatase family protein [uncultured Lichenicoccus sp.]
MRILLALLLVLAAPGAQAAAPGTIKLATWNLEWLTTRPTGDPSLPDDATTKRPEDILTLAAYATHLDADVVGIQEVDGPEIAARIFPPDRYRIFMTGDHVVQRVGLAVRLGFEVARNPDVLELDVTSPNAVHHLRSGLDVTITRDGLSLRILVVHLKTGCWRLGFSDTEPYQCRLLQRQLAVLRGWLEARQAEHLPFVLMGDFNRNMPAHDVFLDGLEQSSPMVLATTGHISPCWGGEDFIDHIFAGGPAAPWLVPETLRVMVYRETTPEMRERLSDHCAVSVLLKPSR